MADERRVWATGFELHRVGRSYVATRGTSSFELPPSLVRILAAFAEPAEPARVAAVLSERFGLPLAEMLAAIDELGGHGLLETLRPPARAIEREGLVPPSFAARAPHGHRVLVDAYHRTLYRPDTALEGDRGDMAALALLRHDGFAIERHTSAWTELPEPGDTTLFVHGLRPTRDGALLAPAEIDALLRWIDAGGSAFVVAGHDPNEPGLAALLAGLGIDFRGGHAHHRDHPNPQGGPCSWFTMTPGHGLVSEHPLVQGAGLVVQRVGYYCGGALRCEPAAAVLRMPVGTQLHARVDGAVVTEHGDAFVGMCAVQCGRGRVAVVLDRGIFRAQELESERGPLYITMGQPDLHNANLLVATLRWLSA